MDAKLEAVPLVDIDDEGRFKYILIKVYGKEQADGTEPCKLIVRGYKRAQWHGNESHTLPDAKSIFNICFFLLQLTFMMRLANLYVHLA